MKEKEKQSKEKKKYLSRVEDMMNEKGKLFTAYISGMRIASFIYAFWSSARPSYLIIPSTDPPARIDIRAVAGSAQFR